MRGQRSVRYVAMLSVVAALCVACSTPATKQTVEFGPLRASRTTRKLTRER
jgi:hypothetical protein